MLVRIEPAAFKDCSPLSLLNSHTSMLDETSVSFHLKSELPKILRLALKDRIKLVTVVKPTSSQSLSSSWSISAPVQSDEAPEFFIGLIIDAEKSLRVVEYGPAPSTTTAEEDSSAPQQDDELARFKFIWGPKSELRRFKDGRIVESVVYETDGTVEQRSTILPQMVAYLVGRHAGIQSNHIHCWSGDQLLSFLKCPAAMEAGFMPNKSFRPVMESFEHLVKILKGLGDALPLDVQSVVPCSSGLRYTSVFAPQAKSTAIASSYEYFLYQEPLDILIQFEGSARWPDDFTAIQEMKMAFYIKIAEFLREEWADCLVKIVDSHERTGSDSSAFNTTIRFKGRSILTDRYMDITTPSGYTFRCRIFTEREEYLIKEQISPLPSFDKQTLLSRPDQHLAIYESLFKFTPIISAHVQHACLRNPCLPLTIRLVKRWLACHMMLNCQVPEEVVELLCMHAFGASEPWDVPSSAYCGFTRVINMIATWNWEALPLIVHLSDPSLNTIAAPTSVYHNAASEQERKEEVLNKSATAAHLSEDLVRDIEDGFNGARRNYYDNGDVGGPAMYIASDLDRRCALWERKSGNTQTVAKRLVALAKAAIKHMEKTVSTGLASDLGVSEERETGNCF